MFNLTDNALNNQIFRAKGLSDFQVWTKPTNAKFVSIFCLGSGGGGGSGMVGTATTARRGGGGGGSGAYSLGTFAASQIPDLLYLSVGLGGAGGLGLASAGNGFPGLLSYVSVRPNNTAINILMASGAVGAAGGTSGSGGGAGGVGSTVWAGNILNALGLATATAGTNGAAGAISVAAANVIPATIVCGGPSGGNTSTSVAFAGGDVTGSGFLNTVSGGALGSGATTGGNGSDGFMPNLGSPSKSTPTFFTAGSGGGASVSGRGGDGGTGSYGCGGGGGGAGFTALAGFGGKGGDGLIIITAW
jgi:hypothetical protein